MMYERDPIRWTDSTSSDVPDVLRDLMQAGAQELPSTAKLAALGNQVSAAAGTTAATAGMTGATKLWIAGFAIGTAVLGGIGLRTLATDPADRPEPAGAVTAPAARSAAPARAKQTETALQPPPVGSSAPVGSSPLSPQMKIEVTPLVLPDSEREADTGQPAVLSEAKAAQTSLPPGAEPTAPVAPASQAHGARAARSKRRAAAKSPTLPAPTPSVSTGHLTPDTVQTREEGANGPSEVQLLQQARQALAVSPSQALELARRHAARFPDSQFAQERTVVVIEALTRSGQMDRAREEARRFIRQYPNSAHAHRFRESLGL